MMMLLRNGDGEKEKTCFEVRRRDLLIQISSLVSILLQSLGLQSNSMIDPNLSINFLIS